MPFRLLPLCIVVSLVGVGAALAEPAPPPGRVGRIAAVTGPVSFHLAGDTSWQAATRNLPVTDGTALWVAAGGEAAVGLGGGNRVVLAPGSEFDLDRLDDQALAATQPQGESYFRLRRVSTGETYTVQTLRGAVTMASTGRYAIGSGDAEHPTTVTVLDGAATLSGIPQTAEIGAGQMLSVTGDGAATPFAASKAAAVPDAFLRHVLAEDQPPAARPAAAPAIIGQMTGAEALAEVGEWSETPEYGPVWYPPVPAYVPYRQGRWAYVAPWGWTWVDDAAWGFAPTHYGRWAQVGGRWGWVPGRDWAPDRRPVYAPALVGFFGAAALGFAHGPAVGWAPLGPRDSYRPPFPANEGALRALNQPTGAPVRFAGAPVTINRSAITIVPGQVLTTSAPVTGALRPGAPLLSIGPAPVLEFRPQAVPTRATIGATPAVLREVNPVGLTAPATHAAPGPMPAHRPAPEPQIGPASLLGGAMAGAVAGSLLRPPPPRSPAELPRSSGHDMGRPAFAAHAPMAPRPSPPVRPVVAAPHGPAPFAAPPPHRAEFGIGGGAMHAGSGAIPPAMHPVERRRELPR